MKKTIADYPEVAKEFHPTKNGNLTPCNISYGSEKKIWWICKKGHEWEATCDSRTGGGTGCPYCANQKVCKDNCLATLYPEVAKEFHPTKNGNLTPFDVIAGSHKKYWWICSKGHEWEASCSDRTGINKTGCPYCANKKVCKDNCLATTHPELIKEWHPTLNGDLTPYNVLFGSDKKVWWFCNEDHCWEAKVSGRTSTNKTNCPYCANKKVCNDNCLATLYPELVKEWHPTKNGSITPNDVLPGANKKYWWICCKGHEFEASCSNRTYNKSNCPYCANQKVCKDNCLSITHPEIAKEWHPTKNRSLTPNDIIAGTDKKYWWICKKGHEWEATCDSRTGGGTGCPYCANKKVCNDNCLATLYPELVKEWHPTKNGSITPNDVLPGTNKKYWWICCKGHEWKSHCANRTTLNRGCPICCESKGEKEVDRILKKLNIKEVNREHRFSKCKDKKSLPFDFVIYSNQKVKIIEYHGIQHYVPVSFGSSKLNKHENFKGIQKRDKIKREFCEDKGIPFLEISYNDYDKIEEKINKFLFE